MSHVPQEQEFDAIVVGAGPAGATTAYYLAHESRQQGRPLRVALLDKARFPRDKYCGDAWCAPALDILEDMGVLQKLIAEGLYQDTTSGGFVSPSGENYMTSESGDVQVRKENRTFAIRRMICDERIARRAAEVGADLIEDAQVSEAHLSGDCWQVRCADGRRFRSAMLIAADGATSRLARSLGIIPDAPTAAAARRYVKGGTHNFKAGGVLLFPEYILPGYVALFRHYNDDIDLGAYIIPGGAARVEDAARIYDDRIYNDPFIQRVLGPRVEFLEPVRTASLRMGGVARSTGRRFMAVGDAAGQTDPLTGEGIHTAMIGGRIAARRVLEMFAACQFDEAASALYHQRWMEAFGKDFNASALSARMSFRFPFFLDAAAKLAERSGDRFMNEFGAIMTGVKPKSTYARPDIAFPLGWEVSKQFFKQKILRQAAGEAAYRKRAEENPARSSAFSTVCLRDPKISARSVADVWAQKNRTNPAEELFRFASDDPEARPLLILYGSEYGYCKNAALHLAEELATLTVADAPLSPRVLDLAAHTLIDWSREPLVLLLCATAGDGDFPDNAQDFARWLSQATGNTLGHTAYALLACGDSTYPNFCRAGHHLHTLLQQAGAHALNQVHEVDQEDEDQLAAWFDTVHTLLKQSPPPVPQDSAGDYLQAAVQAHYAGQDDHRRISRQHPRRARILAHTRLTASDEAHDSQETVSLELDLRHFPDPRRMDWQPGDALGVLPHNPADLVTRILELMALAGDTPITLGTDTLSLEDALRTRLDIKPLSRARVEKFLARIKDDKEHRQWQSSLATHAGDEAAAAREYAQGRELIDLLEDYPQTACQLDVADWLKLLPSIQPRFYSIASSPLTDTEQLTLCVSRVRYQTHGRTRSGLASNYLAAQLNTGDECDVFLQTNKSFRPPPLDTPVGCVMIGPGTGVAPFRGFVQHLAKQAASHGKRLAEIWPQENTPLLFFGCRHPDRDFLYREEWQALDAAGDIRLFTAFSRSQPEKIYVQHRLRDEAALIWQRLEGGAQFFICGDATHMAGDVEQTLLDIIIQQGNKSRGAARAYLDALAAAGRYHKDVWA